MMDSNLKKYMKMFLKSKKHPGTVANYQFAFKMLDGLEIIDIKAIINHCKKVMNLSDNSNETKNLKIRCLKSFLNSLAFSTMQNQAIFEIKKWKFFEQEEQKRQSFNAWEVNIIAKSLEEFGNAKFALIFKMMAHNGLRLGEFTKINFENIKNSNYEVQFRAKKNGNPATFIIPRYLIKDFEELGVKYTYNSLQNIFNKFGKFVRQNNPTFTKPIHAHIMRHVSFTKGHENGLTAQELAISSGLTSPKVLQKTYIHFDMSYQRQLWYRKNMPSIKALEEKQKDDLINTQRLLIIKLKDKLIAHGLLDPEHDEENVERLFEYKKMI